MWIPHTVPKSTLHLFTSEHRPDVVGTLPNDVGRVVKSEDFNWADRTPKPLKLLCLDSIANDFTQYTRDLFEFIMPMNAVYFVEILSTNLPIPLVVHVPDGEYWRRRIDDAWPNATMSRSVKIDGLKTFYLTRYVSETIENLEPGYVDEAELSDLLRACSPHVTALTCKQLRVSRSPLDKLALEESYTLPRDPVHVGVDFVLGHLENVRSVSLVYGPEKITADETYTSDLYKINIDDMDTLGRGLALSKCLTSLAIIKSDINATKFNRLLPYLIKCRSLEEIDFSFCNLQSPGAKSVAYYVKTANRLRRVNLCCNNIGSDAVESLAFVTVWRRNNGYSAIELNLNMNNIGDIGAKYLASALASGVQPFTKIRIRNCNVTEIGGVNIVKSLTYDRGLSSLELDNNPFTLEVAISLHAMFKTNFNIVYISTRNCNFPTKMANFLRNVAFHNRHNKRSKLDYVDVDDLCDDVEEENVFHEESLNQKPM